MVLDGDMQTDYVYNADELTVKQEKDVSYERMCKKSIWGRCSHMLMVEMVEKEKIRR